MAQKNFWKVEVKGEQGDNIWEISVVHTSNQHGISSYGGFGGEKILVGCSGGPCRLPVCGFVWGRLLQTAYDLCQKLNAGETLDKINSPFSGYNG